jgi:hypothetical protein
VLGVIHKRRRIVTVVLSILVSATSMHGCAAGGEGGEDDPEEYREVADPETILREVARESPPAERFEFVGYVKIDGEDTWIHETPPEGNVRDVLEAHGIDVDDPSQGVKLLRDG